MKIAILVSNFCLLFYALVPVLILPNANKMLALLFAAIVVALNLSVAFGKNLSGRLWGNLILIGTILCNIYLLKLALCVELQIAKASIAHRIIHTAIFTIPVLLSFLCIWKEYKLWLRKHR